MDIIDKIDLILEEGGYGKMSLANRKAELKKAKKEFHAAEIPIGKYRCYHLKNAPMVSDEQCKARAQVHPDLYDKGCGKCPIYKYYKKAAAQ